MFRIGSVNIKVSIHVHYYHIHLRNYYSVQYAQSVSCMYMNKGVAPLCNMMLRNGPFLSPFIRESIVVFNLAGATTAVDAPHLYELRHTRNYLNAQLDLHRKNQTR